MAERIPCSQYDETNHKCRSGFIRLHGICWGGSGACPECMKGDGPAPHLMREGGLPIAWPADLEAELAQARARIAAALALLSPENAYTFQSIPQLQRALIKALTA